MRARGIGVRRDCCQVTRSKKKRSATRDRAGLSMGGQRTHPARRQHAWVVDMLSGVRTEGPSGRATSAASNVAASAPWLQTTARPELVGRFVVSAGPVARAARWVQRPTGLSPAPAVRVECSVRGSDSLEGGARGRVAQVSTSPGASWAGSWSLLGRWREQRAGFSERPARARRRSFEPSARSGKRPPRRRRPWTRCSELHASGASWAGSCSLLGRSREQRAFRGATVELRWGHGARGWCACARRRNAGAFRRGSALCAAPVVRAARCGGCELGWVSWSAFSARMGGQARAPSPTTRRHPTASTRTLAARAARAAAAARVRCRR